MSQRNCPNCGAPYDVGLNKCPYCGTSYFDMSAINIDEREPFYLKLKINGMAITQKVIVNPNVTIEIKEDNYCAYDHVGNRVSRIATNRWATTNLSFITIADEGRLYTVMVGE